MNLVLTLDYELYGDGSGDVFQHMINPTNRILSICDMNNIKTTIFFEVLEYIKLREEWESGNQMGYNKSPSEAIEIQLQKAAINGHDIQLHVHPQWVNAKFVANKWQVDMENWRLGDFNVSQNYSIEDMLREGIETIEALIQPILPAYKCTILRAGGYNILPSKKVYEAMIKVGLLVDSSVYPGGYVSGSLSQYDYRKVSLDKDYWWAEPSNFSISTSTSKVLEIPVFAIPQRRLKKFNWERVKSVLQNRHSAIGAIKSKTEQKSKLDKIKYFFEKEAFTWDFCLFGFGLHKTYIQYIDRNLKDSRSHFVLIGHPKSFTCDKAFKKMINYAKRKNYSFETMQFYSKPVK
jgi:hypothetical protein